MNKILLKIVALFVISIVFTNCKNPPSTNASNTISKYTDSFIVIEQNNVIGNLKFGMNKTEAKNEIDNFNKMHTRDYSKYIGNYIYQEISPLFYKGRLYEIEIMGLNDADKCYDLESELIHTMEQKYGRPDFTQYDTSRFTSSITGWTVGRKNIEIGLQRSIHDVQIKIYLPDVEKQNDKELEEREEFVKDSLAKSGKNVF